MKFGLIGAMEEEIHLLKQAMQKVNEQTKYGFTFMSGQLNGQQVVLVQSGIGKVNATMSAVLLKQLYDVDLIINTGSAGGIGEGLSVGDIVVANSLLHHDVDVTAFGYARGQMAQMPATYHSDPSAVSCMQQVCDSLNYRVRFGQIVSGDSFVSSQEQVAVIRHHFPQALACEMESAAIAQAAYVMQVPFVIVRAISDNGDESASVSFDTFIIEAGKRSAQMVMRFLEQYNH